MTLFVISSATQNRNKAGCSLPLINEFQSSFQFCKKRAVERKQ
jgi:hypothetical protein